MGCLLTCGWEYGQYLAFLRAAWRDWVTLGIHTPSRVGGGLACGEEWEHGCHQETPVEQQPDHAVPLWHKIPVAVTRWPIDVDVTHTPPPPPPGTAKGTAQALGLSAVA